MGLVDRFSKKCNVLKFLSYHNLRELTGQRVVRISGELMRSFYACERRCGAMAFVHYPSVKTKKLISVYGIGIEMHKQLCLTKESNDRSFEEVGDASEELLPTEVEASLACCIKKMHTAGLEVPLAFVACMAGILARKLNKAVAASGVPESWLDGFLARNDMLNCVNAEEVSDRDRKILDEIANRVV